MAKEAHLMKELKNQRDMLRAALKDLDSELRSLRASKRELEEKLKNDSGKLDFVKGQELKLRNLISLSMKKEDLLTKKKNRTKDCLVEINEKIDKVRSVERELKDV